MIASVIKVVLLSTIIIVFMLLLASYKGIPVVGLILLALIVIYTFVTQKTVIGRHIYAVGGNRNAARLTGVNTKMDRLPGDGEHEPCWPVSPAWSTPPT